MISPFMFKVILLFLLFLSDRARGYSGTFMYDAYLVNETDFLVSATVNQTMGSGLCAINTRYSGLKAFRIMDGKCLMGNISLTGKPDLNGTMVYVDIDHARATLDYGRLTLGS